MILLKFSLFCTYGGNKISSLWEGTVFLLSLHPVSFSNYIPRNRKVTSVPLELFLFIPSYLFTNISDQKKFAVSVDLSVYRFSSQQVVFTSLSRMLC
jgi:hypothetical protein